MESTGPSPSRIGGGSGEDGTSRKVDGQARECRNSWQDWQGLQAMMLRLCYNVERREACCTDS